jgi:hypothetical protein
MAVNYCSKNLNAKRRKTGPLGASKDGRLEVVTVKSNYISLSRELSAALSHYMQRAKKVFCFENVISTLRALRNSG